jgi:hypothetical protein
MQREVPGMEFLPASLLYRIDTLYKTFEMDRVTFGGAHPNCESVSLLISDGQQYQPVTKFLKGSFRELVMGIIALDERMAGQLERSLLARMFGRSGRKFVYGKALFKLVRKSLDFKAIFGSGAILKMTKILWGALWGAKMKTLLRKHTNCHYILRVIVLPFEESESVEAARLVDCPAAFAYEHPEAGDIRLMPVCAWAMNKNEILRATAEKYGVAGTTGEEGIESLAGKSVATDAS